MGFSGEKNDPLISMLNITKELSSIRSVKNAGWGNCFRDRYSLVLAEQTIQQQDLLLLHL